VYCSVLSLLHHTMQPLSSSDRLKASQTRAGMSPLLGREKKTKQMSSRVPMQHQETITRNTTVPPIEPEVIEMYRPAST